MPDGPDMSWFRAPVIGAYWAYTALWLIMDERDPSWWALAEEAQPDYTHAYELRKPIDDHSGTMTDQEAE